MSEQKFLHCDSSNEFLTLHDCIADRAYLRDGKIVFEFSEGFYIAAQHPDNPYDNCLLTDSARVEFVLKNGAGYDAYSWLCVRKRALSRKKMFRNWDIDVLIDNINSGKCKLEFIDHYVNTQGTDENVFLCEFRVNKKPFFCECWLRIYATKVNYYWNNLCPDRLW